jgi:hypothetical protein
MMDHAGVYGERMTTEASERIDLCALRNNLFWAFSDTALWWEEQAAKNTDERNAKAAELLYELAGSVRDIEDKTLIVYVELRENQNDEDEFYELLNSVGWEWLPKTANAFVRRFISERTGAWVDPQNIGV